MNDIIMKAIYESIAQFIRDFFKSASKQGFSIMLLMCAVIALAYYLVNVQGDMQKAHTDCKTDIERVKTEMRTEIFDLRAQLKTCYDERIALTTKVAELTAMVKLKKR